MAQPDGEIPRLEGRNGAVWRRHVIDGLTQEAVAQEFGLSQTRVSQIVAQVRASIPEADRAELVTDSLELLRELQTTALEVMRLAAAPVTVGKDGDLLRDPENGMALVRDHSGRLNALKAALAVNESVRRLLGADAAKGLDL